MTLEEWEEEKDRELDESLTTLFQAVERPEPSAGFASKTMKAVRLAPLAAGGHAHPPSGVIPAGGGGGQGRVGAKPVMRVL